MTARRSEGVLTELLAQAGRDLDAATGGVAVCSLSRAGTSAPGVKYHEGRWAALNEVSRQARRSAQDAGLVAAPVRRVWSEDLDRLTDRGAGVDWVAYRTGGLDALAELVAAITDID